MTNYLVIRNSKESDRRKRMQGRREIPSDVYISQRGTKGWPSTFFRTLWFLLVDFCFNARYFTKITVLTESRTNYFELLKRLKEMQFFFLTEGIFNGIFTIILISFRNERNLIHDTFVQATHFT